MDNFCESDPQVTANILNVLFYVCITFNVFGLVLHFYKLRYMEHYAYESRAFVSSEVHRECKSIACCYMLSC